MFHNPLRKLAYSSLPALVFLLDYLLVLPPNRILYVIAGAWILCWLAESALSEKNAIYCRTCRLAEIGFSLMPALVIVWLLNFRPFALLLAYPASAQQEWKEITLNAIAGFLAWTMCGVVILLLHIWGAKFSGRPLTHGINVDIER